jgi:hypothetical protein
MTMPLPVRAWRVYGSQGETYTAQPECIPRDVQVVVYFHDARHRTLAYGEDEYTVDGVTLYGREIAFEDYWRLVERALNDWDFPE